MDQSLHNNNKLWETSFLEVADKFQWRPAKERKCTDIFGLLIFFLILAFTFYLCKISIPHASWEPSKNIINNYIKLKYDTAFNIIIAMTIMSVVLSIIFLLMYKAFPHGMVYVTICMAGLSVLILIIYSFSLKRNYQGLFFSALLFVFTILFCLFKQKIDTAVSLTKTAAHFLTQATQTFTIPIVTGVIGVAFTCLTLTSLIGFTKLHIENQLRREEFHEYLGDWVVVYIFFICFFYYTMVFLIAWNAAEWHYKSKDQSIWYSFTVFVGNHLGSITIASLLITFINVIRCFVSKEKDENIVSKCFTAACRCCIDQIYYFVQILNGNAVIFMALTGQNYINSAKNGGNLIAQNYQLFSLVQLIQTFFTFSQILICIGIPIFFGMVLTNAYKIIVYETYISISITYLSLLVSIVFLSTFNESLKSLFLFYCFDKKLDTFGKRRPLDPLDIMKIMYQDAFKGAKVNKKELELSLIQPVLQESNTAQLRPILLHKNTYVSSPRSYVQTPYPQLTPHYGFQNNQNNFGYLPPLAYQPPIAQNMNYPSFVSNDQNRAIQNPNKNKNPYE